MSEINKVWREYQKDNSKLDTIKIQGTVERFCDKCDMLTELICFELNDEKKTRKLCKECLLMEYGGSKIIPRKK